MTTVDQIPAETIRDSDHAVHPLFLKRWSPRAFNGEPVSQERLDQLLEAARWAPSSYNGQPWRFVYAIRGTDAFKPFADTLVDVNREWAEQAGALVAIASNTISPKTGDFAPTHAFDTGAAWMAMALQATAIGLAIHAMEGFDKELLATVIALPTDHELHAVVAVGRPGEVEALPRKLAQQEQPSDRKPIADFCFQGHFPES